MKKIGILYICTGEYWKFWDNFYKSCEENFLIDEEKHYFIFTDNQNLLDNKDERIHPLFQEKMQWPYPTLYRYKTFITHRIEFDNMDYLLFCNANLFFTAKISLSKLLNKYEMFATLHPGYFNKSIDEFPYETNTDSLAFILRDETSKYFCGGFNGGSKDSFLNMCEILDKNISIDLDNNVIALWHDESHFNSFVSKNKSQFNIIDSSFCYPESRNLKIDKKIVVLDKDNLISIKHKGFFYGIRYYLIKNIRNSINYIKDFFS